MNITLQVKCLCPTSVIKIGDVARRIFEVGAPAPSPIEALPAFTSMRVLDVLRVLANLRFNEEINRSVLGSRANSTSVTVRSLDWTDYADRVRPETLASHSIRASPAWEAPCCHADKVLLQAASAEPSGRLSRTKIVDQPVLSDDDVADENPSGRCGCSRRRSSVSACQRGHEVPPGAGEDPLGTPEVLLAADVVYDVRCDMLYV